MRRVTIPASSGTSERRCHCGARFEGADHCPFCGCEQYERMCDAIAEHNLPAWNTWIPGQRWAGYDNSGQSDMGEPSYPSNSDTGLPRH
jgi:hypothetical protein